VTPTDDELFRGLERELLDAHEGTPDLATIERLYAQTISYPPTLTVGSLTRRVGWTF
jgi:hypothetical protein